LQAVWVCVFLALAVLAVFGQTAGFAFVNLDDPMNVFANPVVAQGLSIKAVGWAFAHAQLANWVPLTTLSHILDCQIFGLRAGGHHLVNVLLHAATVVLLFLALRQMTGSLWRSAFVAALFAVHPLRAESVAWVSERKDVLSGLFFMLALGAYVRQARQPSRAGAVVVFILFALGLLAKSMVATLPFVLLLLDYWPLERLHNRAEFLRRLREKIPLFALAAGGCLAAALAPGLLITGHDRLPLLERIGNGVVSYVVYLGQMVFPAGLAVLYPNPPNGEPPGKVCLALVLLAAISAGVIVCRKKRPYLLAGWLWYLGMLFPVIGIIQISSYAQYADRYTYLPGIGLAMAVTWAVADGSAGWKHQRLVLGGLMIVAAGALMICACVQTSYWKDSETLWNRAVACTSGNSVAYNNLGYAHFAKGNWEAAIAEYGKAIEILPEYEAAHYNLACALLAKGDRDAAIAEYRKALELKPDNLIARNNLANALLAKGVLDEAIAQYRKALEFVPDDVGTYNNLGYALLAKGDSEAGLAQYRKAIEIQPDNALSHYNFGNAFFSMGDWDQAIAHYQKAVAIQPALEKARHSLVRAFLRKGNFDGAMACLEETNHTSADPLSNWRILGDGLLQKQELEEAILCYRQAIKINPRSADVFNSLGVALVQTGETTEAMESWQKALEINPGHVAAQKNLAWLLATTPDPFVRDGKKAVALAAQASQSSGGGNPAVLRILAAAYAEEGSFELAAATARRALELAAGQKQDALAATLQKEIKLYQGNTPLRIAPR
jgi:tetratricopeptide (TPR) repeat protein